MDFHQWTILRELQDRIDLVIKNIRIQGTIKIWFETSIPERIVSNRVVVGDEVVVECFSRVPDRDNPSEMITTRITKHVSPEVLHIHPSAKFADFILHYLQSAVRNIYDHEFRENFYYEGKRVLDPHVGEIRSGHP